MSYHDRLEARPAEAIDLIVVHATELPSMAAARDYAERIVYPGSGTGCCGHYYVDRDGTLRRYVADERVAHHAGAWNARSIGVELVNLGRYPHWFRSDHQTCSEPFPAAQLDALVALVGDLHGRLPGIRRLAGHADLDRGEVPAEDDPTRRVRRKVDPGPLFPWDEVVRRTGLARLRPP